MVYAFSYVKDDGTMYCQMMRCSSSYAIHILEAYAKHSKGITQEDLSSCVELINVTEHVDPVKQVTFTGKTLSVCIQNDQ